MKVLLIDADKTGFSNLALMKRSAFHKKQGDEVGLLGNPNAPTNPDEVYISCVFPQNAPRVLGLAKMYNCPVHVGGSGVDLASCLPDEVEHIMPDYSLYGIRFSMGFLSRGCNNNCPWCIVPKKEGKIRDHARLDEFYVPRWGKLRLLDNNFLQAPRWYENLKEIRIRKIRVDFNQGLDIRLVDQEKAKMLAKCRCSNTDFNGRLLRFSFDLPQIEDKVVKGIETLVDTGWKRRNILVYVLTGFFTTLEEDLHRIKVLRKLGVLPYVMVYNDRRDKPILQKMERWINGRFYNIVPNFEDYNRLTQNERLMVKAVV